MNFSTCTALILFDHQFVVAGSKFLFVEEKFRLEVLHTILRYTVLIHREITFKDKNVSF